LPGLRALDPKVLRRLAAIEEAANLRPDDVGDPVHDVSPRLMTPYLSTASPAVYPGPASAFAPARAPHALGQFRDEAGHRFDGLAVPPALLARLALPGAAHPRADPPGLAPRRDLARVLRRAHAEADRDRQLGVPFDARHRGRDLARVGRSRARNAGDRDV